VFVDLLVERMGSLVELTPIKISQLEEHFNLLNRWNKVLNLTAIRDAEAIVERHYCESLFLGKHLPPGTLTIADVGSGAGFPGIPVAIQRPECSMALIESHQRKSVFLSEAARGLPNIRVIPKRGEDLTERFDWAVSRGVNFRDNEQPLRELAGNVALLGGEENPNSRFTWNKIKLPWGNRRFLWIHRST
jgi:16S rRNA (guanine(527)-N(7))-methyltransferase RsmG